MTSQEQEQPYDLEIIKVGNQQSIKLNNNSIQREKQMSINYNNQLRSSSIQQGEPQHDKYWHQPSRDQNLWHQSSSTWFHSSNHFQFGKESRFENTDYKKQRQVYNSSLYSLPSTRTKLSCSQGFGQRAQYPLHHQKIAQINPAPDQYYLKSFVKDNKFSKSFGLGWSNYYNNYYPEYYKVPMKKPQPEFMRHSVGPGRYEVREKIGNDKVKFSFGVKIQNNFSNDNPPCNIYSLKEKIVSNERYSKITLGKGNKIDFSKPLNHNPGPGNYQIPSFTDKFSKNMFRYSKNRQNFSIQDKNYQDLQSAMKNSQKWIP